MSMLKSLISLVSVASILVVTPVFAQSKYIFNRYVGEVWLHSGEIYKNIDGGVTAVIRVNMPFCDRYSNLNGYIQFDYYAKDNGYFENYKFYVYGYEGKKNVKAFVNVPANMDTDGDLYISDKTYCY